MRSGCSFRRHRIVCNALTEGLSSGARLVAISTVGGLASVAGGGKFGNGAVTAAFGYLFNRALKARSITERSDDRFIRQFELDEAAGAKGGVVIQRMDIVETRKDGKALPDSWFEVFPVEARTKEAFPADTWEMGVSLKGVTMGGSATYYEGVTEQDVKNLGFTQGGNLHAGSLYSFTIEAGKPLPSFGGYPETNAVSETWKWPQ